MVGLDDDLVSRHHTFLGHDDQLAYGSISFQLSGRCSYPYAALVAHHNMVDWTSSGFE